jgi:hypothetical protein
LELLAGGGPYRNANATSLMSNLHFETGPRLCGERSCKRSRSHAITNIAPPAGGRPPPEGDVRASLTPNRCLSAERLITTPPPGDGRPPVSAHCPPSRGCWRAGKPGEISFSLCVRLVRVEHCARRPSTPGCSLEGGALKQQMKFVRYRARCLSHLAVWSGLVRHQPPARHSSLFRLIALLIRYGGPLLLEEVKCWP